MEERVSLQNEGQRPWTWPQVIARGEECQDATELQHLEEQLCGPQTWYPCETSISSLVKGKKWDLGRIPAPYFNNNHQLYFIAHLLTVTAGHL